MFYGCLQSFYSPNLPKVVPPTSSHSAPSPGTVTRYTLVLLTLRGSSYISSHFLASSKYRSINKHSQMLARKYTWRKFVKSSIYVRYKGELYRRKTSLSSGWVLCCETGLTWGGGWRSQTWRLQGSHSIQRLCRGHCDNTGWHSHRLKVKAVDIERRITMICIMASASFHT